jgi:hypothetical protein
MLELLTYLNWLLASFFIVGPIAMGAYMLFFSRRFTLATYRWRKSYWKIGYSEFDLRIGRVFAKIIGAVLLIGGVIGAFQLVF